jgi:uncharacterized phage-like protein YoqJ
MLMNNVKGIWFIDFILDDSSAIIIRNDQCKPTFLKCLKRFTVPQDNYELKQVTEHNPLRLRQKKNRYNNYY